MIFAGHTELTIDAKLRLAIPARYRQRLEGQSQGSSWFCIPWPSGVLRIYPAAEFEKLSALRAASLTPEESEAELDSVLHGFAEQIDEDSAGRIILPKLHLELTGLSRAGLPKEVIVVGARTRLEVCDKAAWQASLQERFARLPSLVAQVDGRSPTTGG